MSFGCHRFDDASHEKPLVLAMVFEFLNIRRRVVFWFGANLLVFSVDILSLWLVFGIALCENSKMNETCFFILGNNSVFGLCLYVGFKLSRI